MSRAEELRWDFIITKHGFGQPFAVPTTVATMGDTWVIGDIFDRDGYAFVVWHRT